jgi:hypothetical protein
MGNELTTFEMFALIVCIVDLALWVGLGTIAGLLVWYEESVGEGSRN